MLAGRLSLLVGVVGLGLVAALLGTLLGAVAGWRGGVVIDRAITRAADVLLALPRLVLLLVGVALWQPGIATILVVLVLTGWMGIARLVRAEVRTRARAAVRARGDGARRESQSRVLLRHVLPNAIGPAHRRDDARRRQRDPARERPVVSRARHPAAGAELGQHDRRWSRPAGGGAVGVARAGHRARGHRAGDDDARRRVARSLAGEVSARMTLRRRIPCTISAIGARQS